MIAPYKAAFRVSQRYGSPRENGPHQGLDLVGLGDKSLVSPVSGTVERAGWENPLDHSQGFGRYVRIRVGSTAYRMYFGHLSSLAVKAGQTVAPGDLLGTEGSTGKSTGSHLHWELRRGTARAGHQNIAAYAGLPNTAGSTARQGDTGLSPLGGVTLRRGQNAYPCCLYNAALQSRLGLAADGLFGKNTEAAVKAFQTAHGLAADGLVGAKTKAALLGEV